VGGREILEAPMKNASLITRLRRVADGLLPTDRDANIVVIRVVRSSRVYGASIADHKQEVSRASASLQVRWPEDRSAGEFTRDADESERAFLARVRAAVRPYAKRHRVNVVAYSAYR